MVVKVHYGTVLEDEFAAILKMRAPKQSHNAFWQPSRPGLPRNFKVANSQINFRKYLWMTKSQLWVSNKCLASTKSNVTKSDNELWKTVRLRGFQKPQLQYISIFFKFVHVLPVVFTLLFIASFDVFSAGYYYFFGYTQFCTTQPLEWYVPVSCLMIPFYSFKPKSLHPKGEIKELNVASLRTQTYIRSWLLFTRKVKKRPPELRKSKHLTKSIWKPVTMVTHRWSWCARWT